MDHRVDHRYKVADEQFDRSIGSLLEPAPQPGNAVEVYNNGDEIFPPMLDAIASAQRSVTFETFIYWSGAIGRPFADALCERSRAGVRVTILVPGEHIDKQVVRRASRARWGEPLQAGIEMYEYEPTMYHCKIMVIDDRWSTIGSTNIDNRSFRLNEEMNLNALDPHFAARLAADFDADLDRAERITLKQ